MNEYKVTFRNTKRNADETAYVTAKHESDAAHIFAAAHKGDKTYGDIWSVELWRENAPATKEQERAALAKIKALVEELGQRPPGRRRRLAALHRASRKGKQHSKRRGLSAPAGRTAKP